MLQSMLILTIYRPELLPLCSKFPVFCFLHKQRLWSRITKEIIPVPSTDCKGKSHLLERRMRRRTPSALTIMFLHQILLFRGSDICHPEWKQMYSRHISFCAFPFIYGVYSLDPLSPREIATPDRRGVLRDRLPGPPSTFYNHISVSSASLLFSITAKNNSVVKSGFHHISKIAIAMYLKKILQ